MNALRKAWFDGWYAGFFVASVIAVATCAYGQEGNPFVMEGFEQTHEVRAGDRHETGLGAVAGERLPVIRGVAGMQRAANGEEVIDPPRVARRVGVRRQTVVVQVGDGIFIKAVRGPATDDPEEPFEIDTCAMDRHGNVMFQRFGGDGDTAGGGLIPECASPAVGDLDEGMTEAEKSLPTPAEARLALRSVARGLAFIHDGKRDADWRPEEGAVQGTVLALGDVWGEHDKDHNLIDIIDGKPVVIGKEGEMSDEVRNDSAKREEWTQQRRRERGLPAPQSSPGLSSTSGLGTTQENVTYRWYYEKWISAFSEYFGYRIGNHSNIIGAFRRNPPYQYRTVFGRWCACNHGRCGWVCDAQGLYIVLRGTYVTDGMFYKCGSTLTATDRGTTPYLAYCQTSYSPFPWYHVCHDDTLVEFRSIIDNASHSWDWTCYDGYLRVWSPRLPGCDL